MKTMCLVPLLASLAFAQTDFELQAPACAGAGFGYAIPAPCGALGDPEGLSWNGTVAVAVVPPYGPARIDTMNPLGMPCVGTQFLRVPCASVPVLAGGIPMGGPIPAGAIGQAYADVFIPIPTGSSTVSFCWDFYSAEGDFATAAGFNDAMSIDVVGACGGPSLANLVYADTSTAVLPTADTPPPCGVTFYNFVPGPTTETEVAPLAAPQAVVGAAIPAGGAFIRVRAANAVDNDFPSHAVIDGVTFGAGPVPCALVLSAPCGGSLQIVNTACPAAANQEYLIGVSAAVGTYPNGWYFGVDVPLPELINQFNFGFPFKGTLDASGASSFGPIPCGFLPPGIQIWAAVAHWSPGFVGVLGSRPPTTFTIP